MRVLIIRLSSFGDILHTLPAVRFLQRWDPTAELHWLVSEPYAPLIRMVPGIRHVIALPTNIRKWPSVRKKLRENHYEITVDFQGLLKSGLWAWLSGAPRRYGFARKDLREKGAILFYNRRPSRSCETIGGLYREAAYHIRSDTLIEKTPPDHVIFKNVGLVEYLGLPRYTIVHEWDPRVALRVPARARAEVTEWLAQQGPAFAEPVIVHPRAGWSSKQWPEERWRELIRRLTTVDRVGVVITGGPEDAPFIRRILTKPLPGAAVAPFYDWPRTVALAERALAVIAPDTGMAHLGCALDKPVVFLMGATDPNRNGPWRQDRQIAIYHKQPCSPCYRRKCPFSLECLHEIETREVLNRFRLLLEQIYSTSPNGSSGQGHPE